MRLTKTQIIGLALLGAGSLALFLAILGAATRDGPGLLRVWFGWGDVVVVLSLFAGGTALLFAERMGWQVRWKAVLWAALVFLALLALSDMWGVVLGGSSSVAAQNAGTSLALTEDSSVGGVVGRAGVQMFGQALPQMMVWGALLTILAIGVGFLWQSLPGSWTDPPEALFAGAIAGLRDVAARATPSAWALAAGAWLAELWRNLRPSQDTMSGARRIPQPATQPPPRPSSSAAKQSPARKPPATVPQKPQPERKTAPKPEPKPASKPAAKPPVKPQPVAPRSNTLPPLDLLRADANHAGGSGPDVRQRAQTLKQVLADFGVPVEVVSIKEGPTVTQFGLEPGEVVRELRSGEVQRRRVSVHSIMRLSNDLALGLAADSIRIEAPVPGRAYVGVEVPNAAKTLVSLRSILESREFPGGGSPLVMALGRDVSGDPVVADLTRMPHLLIAGATGSGKSVCINAIISSFLMNNSPQNVRLLMVDPKMVELPAYNGIPHLLGPVITDTAQVTGALAWLTAHMDERYRAFSARGVRNITEYNRKVAKSRTSEPLPYIVLVIDELADLMMTAAFDIERQICRLAQMSRATGIHLVLATQRPSVDVITGLIKANFPARIAFAVTSQVDSRVVLDCPGAEKLLGRGDMLFMAPESAKLSRIQGCFVSDREIDSIARYWKAARDQAALEGSSDAEASTAPWASFVGQEEHDELLDRALQLLQTKKQVSTSLLQRQLRIGYPRAARLMEQLEEMDAVGPDEGGGRSREVLLSSGGQAEAL